MNIIISLIDFINITLVSFSVMWMVKSCYQKNPYLFKKDNSSEWINLLATKLVPLVYKMQMVDYRKNIVKKLETLGNASHDPKANFFIAWQISLFIIVFFYKLASSESLYFKGTTACLSFRINCLLCSIHKDF